MDVCTEVYVSPPVVTECGVGSGFVIFFGISWHRWLIPCLPSWFLADGLEHHHATASGPFLMQGIDIQNRDI